MRCFQLPIRRFFSFSIIQGFLHVSFQDRPFLDYWKLIPIFCEGMELSLAEFQLQFARIFKTHITVIFTVRTLSPWPIGSSTDCKHRSFTFSTGRAFYAFKNWWGLVLHQKTTRRQTTDHTFWWSWQLAHHEGNDKVDELTWVTELFEIRIRTLSVFRWEVVATCSCMVTINQTNRTYMPPLSMARRFPLSENVCLERIDHLCPWWGRSSIEFLKTSPYSSVPSSLPLFGPILIYGATTRFQLERHSSGTQVGNTSRRVFEQFHRSSVPSPKND